MPLCLHFTSVARGHCCGTFACTHVRAERAKNGRPEGATIYQPRASARARCPGVRSQNAPLFFSFRSGAPPVRQSGRKKRGWERWRLTQGLPRAAASAALPWAGIVALRFWLRMIVRRPELESVVLSAATAVVGLLALFLAYRVDAPFTHPAAASEKPRSRPVSGKL